MQVTHRLSPLGLGTARSAAPRHAAPASTGEEPPTSALERWTERFCRQVVAWGEGATHHRMGSWTQRTLR